MSTNSNASSTKQILPVFEASLKLSDDVGPIDAGKLQHNCSLGIQDHALMFCMASNVWVDVSCTGKGSARIVRACPEFKQVCTVLNVVDNSIWSSGYCQNSLFSKPRRVTIVDLTVYGFLSMIMFVNDTCLINGGISQIRSIGDKREYKPIHEMGSQSISEIHLVL